MKAKTCPGAPIDHAVTAAPVLAPAVIDPKEILTIDEVAARLQISRRWVYEKTRRRSQNPLPCIRIGRYLRFDWVRVSAWLREQERAA